MEFDKKILISAALIAFSVYLLFSDNKLLAQLELSSRLKGKILLQVEANGEAWYVYPYDLKRYYLGRPKDAFDIMRNLSVGISNEDISQIPVAEANFTGPDSDNDGLSDSIEAGFGTDSDNPDTDSDGYGDREEILNGFDPLGDNALTINSELANKLSGLILLQIEQNGEAWYVNPDDLKRYYLGRPSDAFNLMRKLGLGITDNNIAKIDEYKNNEEYTPENIINKFTKLIDPYDNTRKYTEPDYGYSFSYPGNWTVKKYEYDPDITQITDANRDYILEKKGVITLRYMTAPAEFEVNTFRIASKGKSEVLSDEAKTINDKDAYENSYKHELAYEKTTTIQISPTEFIQVTLANAKYNYAYYETVYSDLLDSLTFSE